MNTDLSIVVPVYNSEGTLRELYRRIKETLEKNNLTFEIIFVNDNSLDNSWVVLRELRSRDKRVKIIDLSRNFGQQNATMCGFNFCRGKFIVTIDDDLQNPPEEIIKLYHHIQNGYDVVMGVSKARKHKVYRNLGSKLINMLNVAILDKPKHITMSSFRIMRKSIVEKIVKNKNVYSYIPAYIFKYVKKDKVANIEVNHRIREHGRSNYTLKKLIKLFSTSLINNSSIPLRLGIRLGLLISFICFLFAMYVLYRKIFGHSIQVPGWASTAVLISFLFGVLFVYLGIIGEYLYRILIELSNHDQFVINEMEIDD